MERWREIIDVEAGTEQGGRVIIDLEPETGTEQRRREVIDLDALHQEYREADEQSINKCDEINLLLRYPYLQVVVLDSVVTVFDAIEDNNKRKRSPEEVVEGSRRKFEGSTSGTLSGLMSDVRTCLFSKGKELKGSSYMSLGHLFTPRCLAFCPSPTPENWFVTSDRGGYLRIWNFQGGKKPHKYDPAKQRNVKDPPVSQRVNSITASTRAEGGFYTAGDGWHCATMA
ncbi:hypothetical protein LXL04_026047 [Taraxacum kok-saghyz]